MKELYERPMIAVEEFIVNRAIAACGDEIDRKIVFDCMIGPNRDITSVVTDSCNRKAGTTTLTTARAMYSTGHSDYTGGSWSTSGSSHGGPGGGNSTITYTAPASATGLIYFCSATNGYSCFEVENGVLTHNTRHGGQYHVQVAPLYGTSIEEVNVGS